MAKLGWWGWRCKYILPPYFLSSLLVSGEVFTVFSSTALHVALLPFYSFHLNEFSSAFTGPVKKSYKNTARWKKSYIDKCSTLFFENSNSSPPRSSGVFLKEWWTWQAASFGVWRHHDRRGIYQRYHSSAM